MKGLSGSLVWKGVLSLIIGVVAIAWPGITVGAFVLLFAVYAFVLAIFEGMRAFSSRTAGPVAGRLLLALLDVAAGVVAIVWPGITVLVLVILVAAWAFVSGVFEVVLAFGSGLTAGDRALLGLTGLVSVALGVVLAIRPDIGAISLAEVYGLFSIIYGISALVLAANISKLGKRFESAISA
ncbi:MAG TPA: DUF308 domain-containing protein [Actinoplanes sp.]|jgi:uncharacterized membrane protein HdeD (DUF308 family)|nr:DUF308 domain-containing protein [Actinoplanes sp.]